MAMDLISGSEMKVEIGTAGIAVATDFEEVPLVTEFVTTGFESTTISVKVFGGDGWERKLHGGKSMSDISLVVAYLADNAVHQKLDAIAFDNRRCQIKISHFDQTKTEGFYAIYNCLVTAFSNGGGMEEVVTRTYTLVVDGGYVERGLITE